MTRILPFLLAQAVALTWTPTPPANTTLTVYRSLNGCGALTSGLFAQIASGVAPSGPYQDSNIYAGTTPSYIVTVTDGVNVSPASNCVTPVAAAPPPPPTLPATTITTSTKPGNALMTLVTVTVMSGSTPVTGTVTWNFADPKTGKVTKVYATALDKSGQGSEQIPTLLLQFIPLTLNYLGTTKYAPSQGTLQ